MKSCLDDNELLQLLVTDAGEYADVRAHLLECPRCAERYREISSETGKITNALMQTADHLRHRESAAGASVFTRFDDGFRTAAVFFGAAAFGGAVSFALLLALGWRPAVAPSQIARASVNNSARAIASISGGTGNRTAIRAASGRSGNNSPETGALYNAEAITSDPLAGLVDSGSMPAANSNSYEDMLFCVPEEDGSICSSSAGQG